jgi:hypothetical protein
MLPASVNQHAEATAPARIIPIFKTRPDAPNRDIKAKLIEIVIKSTSCRTNSASHIIDGGRSERHDHSTISHFFKTNANLMN